RYLLYESEHGNTKLSREIEFMTNYIDLMKLRLNEKILFTVEFNLKDDISVPPLLFIPFIENAFKHGISYREKSFISVNLSAGADSVSFRCVNSLVKGSEKDSSYSGIGLENVRKRLALLFPGKHELKIKKSDGEFEVLLKISLA
ncbi:MAG TPA: histidine kinase, partial [Bacteroidales bacterium]|nr:histidine kinase [Bacteroidales bacterium]